MGTDKALIAIDGRALALRAADALVAAGAVDVALVGGDLDALAALDPGAIATVPDRWPGEGPLGGILTALSWSREPVTMVLSCDLRSPSAAAIAVVVDALDAAGAIVAVPVVAGRRQWLHAGWRDVAAAVLLPAFERGERAIHRAIAETAIVEVGVVDDGAVEDVDSPADL
jgi:molybdopterin-guanine dinucleotide biosynthesis protein A